MRKLVLLIAILTSTSNFSFSQAHKYIATEISTYSGDSIISTNKNPVKTFAYLNFGEDKIDIYSEPPIHILLTDYNRTLTSNKGKFTHGIIGIDGNGKQVGVQMRYYKYMNWIESLESNESSSIGLDMLVYYPDKSKSALLYQMHNCVK